MTFLVLGLCVGVILLHADPRVRWLGDAWFIALVAVYWLLSLPAVAHALISRLQHKHGTIDTPAAAGGARVIVVVGNGSYSYADGRFIIDQLTRRSAFCVFEAARLYGLLQPDRVIVSGGFGTAGTRARPESELMRDELVRFNVPFDRIVLESTSRTTDEQAANVARLLREKDGLARAVVVTTAAHMPRVMALFRARGIDAVPSVTPDLRYDEGRTGWRRWSPSTAALRGSESAMYELLALIYVGVESTFKASVP
jgi:uncharacterized SAM-binding protein YcdF (DUF218 family)